MKVKLSWIKHWKIWQAKHFYPACFFICFFFFPPYKYTPLEDLQCISSCTHFWFGLKFLQRTYTVKTMCSYKWRAYCVVCHYFHIHCRTVYSACTQTQLLDTSPLLSYFAVTNTNWLLDSHTIIIIVYIKLVLLCDFPLNSLAVILVFLRSWMVGRGINTSWSTCCARWFVLLRRWRTYM